MADLPFPSSQDEFTEQWLAVVLRDKGLLTDGDVASVELEPLSEPGQTADLFRVTPTYSGDPGDAPLSLVAKVAAAHAGARELATALNTYANEVGFYRRFGGEEDLPLPTCYAAEISDDHGRFILLLEDLSAARNGSLFGDSLADVERGLAGLAAIHARFWRRTELLDLPWVQDAQASDWIDLGTGLLPSLLTGVRSGYEQWMSADAWAVVEYWGENYPHMKVKNSDAKTLVHLDAHPKQMFYPTAELDRFVIFDWQSPNFAAPGVDVARLMVMGLSVETRRTHEGALFAHYLAALARHGVEELSPERLRYQVHLGNLTSFFVNLLAVVQTDTELLAGQATAEGETWQNCIFGRIGAALDDWDTRGVIDRMVEEARHNAPGG